MAAVGLADFIGANIESIVGEWEKFAQDVLTAHQLDPTTARDHARAMVTAIVADMDRAQSPTEQAEKSKGRAAVDTSKSPATLHGAARLLSGYTITEEVSEFRALRASVLRLWSASGPNSEPGSNDELIRFNEAIDQALAESIARYVADKERHARLFDMFLSYSPDLNFILNLEGYLLYANQALASFYGVPVGELVGKRYMDLDAAMAPMLQRELQQIAGTPKTIREESLCTRFCGKTMQYEFLMVPVINAAGQVEALAGTGREMTNRKQLETALQREKLIADTIIESAPGAFFMLDQQYRLVRWNKYLSKETGMTDAQLRGRSILDSIHEEDRPLAAAKFLAAFATGFASMEVRVLTRHHGIRLYMKTARRFMVDADPFLAGFCIDITDRRQSEDALVEEKRFSDTLIESMPGAFYVIDKEFNFRRCNHYLKTLIGLPRGKQGQRPMLLSVLEVDRPLAAATLKEALEKGFAQSEFHLITKDHGTRLFTMSAHRFQVGETDYLVGIGTDTTERLAKMKSLEHEAWTDTLTQVANRGHFMEIARQEFARCRRYGHPLSVWMLDVDHFKSINDTYGHQGGDSALQSLVSQSQQALRDWDILGRVGGEEFAVLLPETKTEQAMLVAERLRQGIASTLTPVDGGTLVHLTVSIGLATASDEDTDVEMLFKRADQALYEAKQTGRDKVCLAVQHAK